MTESNLPVPLERIERVILLIRGQKVILDSDLAELYGIDTKMLVRAMKRNIDRFPQDFMLQLSKEEFEILRCQFGTSKKRGVVDTLLMLSPSREWPCCQAFSTAQEQSW